MNAIRTIVKCTCRKYNRQLSTFLRTALDAPHDTWSQKVKVFPFAFNSQLEAISPQELIFGKKLKRPIMFNLCPTTDSFGNWEPSLNSPCNFLPKQTHTDQLCHHPQTKKLQKGTFAHCFLKRYTQKFIMKFTTI